MIYLIQPLQTTKNRFLMRIPKIASLSLRTNKIPHFSKPQFSEVTLSDSQLSNIYVVPQSIQQQPVL